MPNIKGGHRGGRPPTYQHNPHAFRELTPEAEYWLGFLITDGCIVGGEDRLHINLAARNAPHLEKLRSFLQSTHPVKITNYSGVAAAAFDINSPKLIADLIGYGVTRRKSHTAMASRVLITRSNFWRGVVDGNGYIALWREKYPYLELTSSFPLCEQFLGFVKRFYPQSKAAICPDGSVWRVRLIGSAAQIIVTVLYKNCCVSLDRKQETADRIIGSCIIIPKKRMIARPWRS